MKPEQIPALIDRLNAQTDANKLDWRRYSQGFSSSLSGFSFYVEEGDNYSPLRYTLTVRDDQGNKIIDFTPPISTADPIRRKLADLYEKIDFRLTETAASKLVSMLDSLS